MVFTTAGPFYFKSALDNSIISFNHLFETYV